LLEGLFHGWDYTVQLGFWGGRKYELSYTLQTFTGYGKTRIGAAHGRDNNRNKSVQHSIHNSSGASMKKILFVVLAICAMIATVAAAPMPASVTLIGVTNGGGGPMFTFRVDGPVSLNGIVHSVEGQYKGDFPLSCKQENETTVICHATKKISGSWVTVEFGGTRSWVQIPAQQEPIQPSYCYGYYELISGSNTLSPEPKASWSWSEVTNICQDTPATNGDKGTYGGHPFEFIQNGLNDSHNYNPGPAYYMHAT
jgi:hypothetical protein